MRYFARFIYWKQGALLRSLILGFSKNEQDLVGLTDTWYISEGSYSVSKKSSGLFIIFMTESLGSNPLMCAFKFIKIAEEGDHSAILVFLLFSQGGTCYN